MKKDKSAKKESAHLCIQCAHCRSAFKRQKNWRCIAYTHVNILDGKKSFIRCLAVRSVQSEPGNPSRCGSFKWDLGTVPNKPHNLKKGVKNHA